MKIFLFLCEILFDNYKKKIKICEISLVNLKNIKIKKK